MPAHRDEAMNRLFASHSRQWRDFDYVYPVVSRRSKGLSIGINVNPDKACNFDCVYCMVDRTVRPARRDVDLDQLGQELDLMLALAGSGEIWRDPQFAGAAPEYRRLNDIAFSGDGEPTMYRRLDAAVALAADLRDRHGLGNARIILITNATGLDRAAARRSLDILDRRNGQVWAKLDAGTPDYYRQVDRSKYPLSRVLRRILDCGRDRAIVIQSLFLCLHGQPVPDEEFAAYLDRLAELREAGCRIALVQLYTVARAPAEAFAAPLADGHLDRLGQRFRARLPELNVEVYYGAPPAPTATRGGRP